jgi:hypothetical protein
MNNNNKLLINMMESLLNDHSDINRQKIALDAFNMIEDDILYDSCKEHEIELLECLAMVDLKVDTDVFVYYIEDFLAWKNEYLGEENL